MVTEAGPTPDGVTDMRQHLIMFILVVAVGALLALGVVAVFTGIRGGHGHGGGGNGTAPGLTQIIGHPKGGKSK